ncbi:MAG TPA: nucleoside deaminase [Terriglobales bacterium]|nr:nucleoside deaminase [Terriglobales bacterium]
MKNSFMSRAIELAVENVNARRGGPFAALVVKEGELIAEGTNLVTSAMDPTAHAEITAIRNACRKLNTFHLTGCEIYTSCEPCPMCLGGVYWSRVDRLYYAGTREDAAAAGFDDAFIYAQIQLPVELRSIPMIGMMRQESLAAFQSWRNLAAKVPY